MSKVDVHADLFKLLLTGRSGVAVSEWLGNRLTGRVRYHRVITAEAGTDHCQMGAGHGDIFQDSTTIRLGKHHSGTGEAYSASGRDQWMGSSVRWSQHERSLT